MDKAVKRRKTPGFGKRRQRADASPAEPLANPRHEKFALLLAVGVACSRAYVAAGYAKSSGNGAAYDVEKRPEIEARVRWLREMQTQSDLVDIVATRQRVYARLDRIGRKAEAEGKYETAVRCEELIGRDVGMFTEQHRHSFEWDGDPAKLSEAQLQTLVSRMESMWYGDDQKAIAQARAEAIAELGPPTVDTTAEVIQP